MVAAHADFHAVAGGDGAGFVDDRLPDDRADGEDDGLGRVDHRGKVIDAVAAEV